MGSTVAGQVPFRLGQGRSEAGVGVDHAAHLREAAVDLKMRGKIRGGPQIPLHDVAQKVRHHHLLRRHGGILHPGGLDDDMLSVRRPGGDIAPGQYHKTVLRQALVLPADLLLQLLPHTVLPSPASMAGNRFSTGRIPHFEAFCQGAYRVEKSPGRRPGLFVAFQRAFRRFDQP